MGHAAPHKQGLMAGPVQNIDSGDIVKNAFARYNLSIGVGLAKVAGKV